MNKIKIKEVIVVEGRDDISAIKAAVDAEVIAVNGFSVRKGSNLDRLEKAYLNIGLIIFTDPDYAGEQIRRVINKRYPNSKNAYISKEEGTKLNDVGVENASPEIIIKALSNLKTEIETDEKDLYDMSELIEVGLAGNKNSAVLREILGKKLCIGYSNAKQLLSKLNRYKISKEEFYNALKQ